MKSDFTGILKSNWFYIASVIFAMSLPFSNAFISISVGLLLITSILNNNIRNIKHNFPQRRIFLFIAGIYFIYLAWMVFTTDWKWATYDLRKNISYLLVPIAFLIAPTLSIAQYKRILYVFSIAVVVSAVITFVQFYLEDDLSILDAPHYGFMHHIRFGLQINIAIIILVQLLYEKRNKMTIVLKSGIIIAVLVLFIFLLWHQSLTGIITFLITIFIALSVVVYRQSNIRTRIVAGLVLLLIVIIPFAYLYYAVDRFYNVDSIEPNSLDKFTSEGNVYRHNLDNQSIENGHYVWLYVCEKELKEEWNKCSKLKYNEKDRFGYTAKYTLIRYLTSKNLRKDAEGVRQLTISDIRNIQNGISNYILADKGISLYPRIYVSIWELDSYFKSGNANHRSLAQRFEYTKAAASIIKENIWFGVGTGNWKSAYREFYIETNSQMAPARYGNVHNQYLNYMVKFGIIGLLLILFAIIYPVIKTKAYRNQLFVLFLVIMFIGNLGDANFETHTGSNLFLFFYCLFLVPKSDQ